MLSFQPVVERAALIRTRIRKMLKPHVLQSARAAVPAARVVIVAALGADEHAIPTHDPEELVRQQPRGVPRWLAIVRTKELTQVIRATAR